MKNTYYWKIFLINLQNLNHWKKKTILCYCLRGGNYMYGGVTFIQCNICGIMCNIKSCYRQDMQVCHICNEYVCDRCWMNCISGCDKIYCYKCATIKRCALCQEDLCSFKCFGSATSKSENICKNCIRTDS